MLRGNERQRTANCDHSWHAANVPKETLAVSTKLEAIQMPDTNETSGLKTELKWTPTSDNRRTDNV